MGLSLSMLQEPQRGCSNNAHAYTLWSSNNIPTTAKGCFCHVEALASKDTQLFATTHPSQAAFDSSLGDNSRTLEAYYLNLVITILQVQ